MRLISKLERKLWKLALGEASWVNYRGDFRLRERYGQIARANYAYGMLRSADVANFFGAPEVTAVEFGLADGDGLLNMIDIAAQIEKEVGIRINVVGFDSGTGLPPLQGYKDHPELWSPGDFSTCDREGLIRKVNGRAKIIWGDISKTVDAFVDDLDSISPLGFVSIDLDIYSSTKAALRCLSGSAEKYNPGVSMYFDDLSFFFASECTGELAAIAEFNSGNQFRKIGIDRSLPGFRTDKTANWHSQMYVCQILDHEARQHSRSRPHLNLADHVKFLDEFGLR
jgi:hypothetical protein